MFIDYVDIQQYHQINLISFCIILTVDLLGLLKWQEILNNPKAMERHLHHLMKEEGEEIVKVIVQFQTSLKSQ